MIGPYNPNWEGNTRPSAVSWERDNTNRIFNYYNEEGELIETRPYTDEEEAQYQTEEQIAAAVAERDLFLSLIADLDSTVKPGLENARDELRLFVAEAPEALTLPEIYSGMMTALQDYSDNPTGDSDPYKTVGQIHSRALEYVFDQLQAAQAVVAAQAATIADLESRISALETP